MTETDAEPQLFHDEIFNAALSILGWDSESVAVNDTLIVDTLGFSNLIAFIEVDGAATITLDSVSQDHSNWRTIDETVKAFTGAGSAIIDLSEVIPTAEALKYKYLKFKINAAVKATLEIAGKLFGSSDLARLTSFKSIETDKSTDFTTALAQYVKEDEDITGLDLNKVAIYAIVIISEQQLNFRVHFYSDDTFATASWIGFIDLNLTADGIQISNTGKWLLNITPESDSLLLYEDEDETKELHIALENLSSAAKKADAAGELTLKIFYK